MNNVHVDRNVGINLVASFRIKQVDYTLVEPEINASVGNVSVQKDGYCDVDKLIYTDINNTESTLNRKHILKHWYYV